jgi:hypothetical protein
LDGNNGSAFLLETVIGLNSQYPDGIPLYDLVNSAGEEAIVQGKSMGVFEALFKFMNTKLSNYVEGNIPLVDLLAIPSVNATLKAQELGKTKIAVPLYLYHGTSDEFIPLGQALDLKTKYCKLSTNTTYMSFPGEHITTQFQAAPYVLDWLKDRFNGSFTLGTCTTWNTKPVSTANPVNGDFLFSLKGWTLNGTIHLKTLDQDVILPGGSMFTAETNMTKNIITGSMAIPDFTSSIKLLGIPVDVSMSIVNAKPMTGTASLDNNGILHIHGHAFADIYITKAANLLPFTLHTKEPVDFPIDFDGPVSSLGDGSLKFAGTTTFSDMVDNGFIINALFTGLMSGPGQQFTFTVTPPAPKKW